MGNDTPVFFLRDPLKFPSFIRSQKRRADNNLRDHDMQWDFWTLSPESAHQVTWLMGDRGIPASWRHMNLYSGHTFMWVNAAGEKVWVRYHFITDQGIENLTQAEADALVAVDTDYHTRDLFEAIQRGDYPSWTLKMQIMPFEDAKTYRFNPFDLTKVWPHAADPGIEVGRLTLDRNPTHNHSQIEQGARSPRSWFPASTEPRQDAAGPDVRLPDAQRTHRRELQPVAGQRPHDPCTVRQGRADAVSHRLRPGVLAHSKGGPRADTQRYGKPAGWHNDGEMVRTAYTLRAEDDDSPSRPPCPRRMNDARADRLVNNIVGHLLDQRASRFCNVPLITGAT